MIRIKKVTQAQRIKRLEEMVSHLYNEQQRIIKVINSSVKDEEE